ncbi:hypothetical protein DINM_002203 [Dirofilaria immitis]|nr:hypothetical protein [Dirofilaria immitis]
MTLCKHDKVMCAALLDISISLENKVKWYHEKVSLMDNVCDREGTNATESHGGGPGRGKELEMVEGVDIPEMVELDVETEEELDMTTEMRELVQEVQPDDVIQMNDEVDRDSLYSAR